MKTRTEDLAYELGLEFVEVTQGMNGYPSGLYKAIAGFESFENAESFARQVNGEVVLLTKRDGHQFWYNNGRQWEALERAKFIDENEECVFTDDLSFESWAREELREKLDCDIDVYSLQVIVNDICSAMDKIACMDDSEVAVVGKSEYDCYVYPKYDTHIHDDDVTDYMIAVVDHEEDEDDDI